ncbi:hypothetical protein BS47DRAFT_1335539 [Hydnum rufescens UP504]|uniref:Uncharacterized protein n=1 Tax=Hydnum rufescens UP504 TaxID=1448309 RepID=A0A9P6E0P6_9AGAM|nr:hypothetical protein BS47DRAFT_1335539 [Hydnum rufescens UP504]
MATTTLTKTTTKKKLKRIRSQDPLATLKPLYPPAARAFLRREVGVTQNLIDAAFLILTANPPNISADPLAVPRRKWDLLRITLETTLYSSDGGLNLPPSEFIQTLYTRSIRLYTPTSTPDTPPSSAYLPLQILIALVFASLKLDCPEVGKNMVEHWLNHRDDVSNLLNRLIDVYCLQILPRLGEWDYAMEFLKYEPELSHEKKKQMYTLLKTLHIQAMRPPPTTRMRSSSVSGRTSDVRAPSPASSISSASTRTAVPATSRPLGMNQRSSTSLSTSSLSSSASEHTITPDDVPRTSALNGNGTLLNDNLRSRKDSSRSPHRQARNVRDGDRDSNSAGGSSHTAFPRPPLAPPLADLTTGTNGAPISATIPTLFETLRFYAQNLGLRRPLSRSMAVPVFLLILSVVLPVVAYVVKLRRGLGKRRIGMKRIGAPGLGHPDQVGVVRWLFSAVKDTVVMAGKGLV